MHGEAAQGRKVYLDVQFEGRVHNGRGDVAVGAGEDRSLCTPTIWKQREVAAGAPLTFFFCLFQNPKPTYGAVLLQGSSSLSS